MGTVFGKNTTSSSITVAGHKVYYIDSTDAEIVEVEDGNNVKYNAFKYLLSGTPYWYVIDGEHDTWTDDLSEWGYSEVQPAPVLPEVSVTGDWGSGNWLYVGVSAEYVYANASRLLYISPGGQQLLYDASKSYSPMRYTRSNGGSYNSPVDKFTISGNSDATARVVVNNITSSNLVLYSISVAVCSSNQATVVTVYNSSNVAYNAFKFTASGTDYYYVLDGTQTDWTDDLSGIGYSLTPVTKRGYAYKTMRYQYGETCELTYTAAGGDYIPANTSKRYVVVSISSTPEFDASTIELFNGTSPSRLSARCYSPFNGSLWYVDYYEVDA